MHLRIISLIAALFSFGITWAQDISGAADHPLLSRYSGTVIQYYFERDYYETRYPIAPGAYDKEPQKWLDVAGRQTSIVYEAPKSKSTVDIMKNYEEAFRQKNATILFRCNGGACDGTTSWHAAKFFQTTFGETNRAGKNNIEHYRDFDAYHIAQRYLFAKVTTTDKTYFVVVAATPKYDDKPVKVLVEIIEAEPVSTGKIELNADIFKEQLEKEGRIALYGILFDTGKTEVKPASQQEIALIADYLKRHTRARIYIVGHTDDIGNFGTNTSLAEGRAIKVAQALQQYGNLESRITPIGVGPVCPVASNETEAGRARNRRVEIVLRKQ